MRNSNRTRSFIYARTQPSDDFLASFRKASLARWDGRVPRECFRTLSSQDIGSCVSHFIRLEAAGVNS